MSFEPKIYTGCTVCGGKDKIKGSPSKNKGELKADLLIIDLWIKGMESIHKMRVMNNDATYHQSKTPKKCMDTADNNKKKKYLDACIKQRRHFTPFIISVEGLLGFDAETTLKRITRRLEKKWK